MFGRRADATLIRNLPTMRRIMPYVSPRRNDSLFYMMQEIDVEAALEFLDQRNRDRPAERPIKLFHLLLRSGSQALCLRPGVNRFVKAGRLWQRDGEWITLSAKREIADGSPIITIKHRFHPSTETLDEMVDAIYDRLSGSRQGTQSQSDKEMDLLFRLPGFAVRPLMGLLRAADWLGLLPRAMIEADPLFTSCFVANLGSIGYPAGFHHLWEYGTCSLFAVIGRVRIGADGRRKIDIAWTYDERIEDGLYSQITLQGIAERLENPQRLLATSPARHQSHG